MYLYLAFTPQTNLYRTIISNRFFNRDHLLDVHQVERSKVLYLVEGFASGVAAAV